MFNRFATVLHNAVDALAPPLPAKDEFEYHWKAVTKFFVDKRSDSKAPIEFTNIPGHLEQMMMLLMDEQESTSDANSLGPCMEYLLHHKLLDTLQTLARADCPPGMKQHILVFVSQLLGETQQPLLPHVRVYKAVNHLIKLCGEIKASPTESEEIHFLCIICAKLKNDPSLVNFFLQNTRRSSVSEQDSGTSTSAEAAEDTDLPDFSLVNSLLTLSQSADSHVAVKACEGLMMIASLPVELSARCLIEKTKFTQVIAERLGSLYKASSKTLDPEVLDRVDAKWGFDPSAAPDDLAAFTGKRQIVSFLSWLDYCDQMIDQSHATIGLALARAIRGYFLHGILETDLCQISNSGAVLATTWVIKCICHITTDIFVQEFGYFLLGESGEPELPGVIPHPLKQLLIERCCHPNKEVTLSTLRLFEVILERPVESSLHRLVLTNLLSREYYDHAAVDYQGSWTDDEDELTESRSGAELFGLELDVSPGSSPVSRTMAPSSIHRIINCFLLLLPSELKSCDSEEELGYENYLRDAHRQYQESAIACAPFDWPHESVSREEMHQSDNSSSESQAEADKETPFYEGSFLSMLLDKMENILDQPYEVNLQVTSITSKLAHIPHPNLHEFLLNPLIPVTESSRTLFSCLEKSVSDIQVRIQRIPGFKRKLYLTRKILLGDNSDYSSVDGSSLLEGLIVLEEFCKELAAIAFVKCHASS